MWQCLYAEQNRDRDVNHRMIVTSEMIAIFQLIEKREEEIDQKIVRNEDAIEGKASASGVSTKLFSVKIVTNVGIATRAKIVMARNEDEDDDLFHDHHVPRRLLLAVMVSFEEVLVINIVDMILFVNNIVYYLIILENCLFR